MKKIIKEHKRLKIGDCFGAFISILLMFCAVYFNPNFVANNLSPDGILKQTTIFQINFIRLGFSILSTTGLLISGLYIIKPNLFYLLQLRISKILLITKLFIMKGSVKETREPLMEIDAGNNARNCDLHISVPKGVITRSLIVIVILLHLASAFAVWLQHNVSNFFLRDLYIKIFLVTSEGKIPTWYSACTLLFCALLLSVISFLKRQSRDPYFWNWVGLAALSLLTCHLMKQQKSMK